MALWRMRACLPDSAASLQPKHLLAHLVALAEKVNGTYVRVRLAFSPGLASINMYDLGVTMAGLMKRRKKKPPIRVQMVWS